MIFIKLEENKKYSWICYCSICNKFILIIENGKASSGHCPFCNKDLILSDFNFKGEYKNEK